MLNHVLIIPDGNRRFANLRNIDVGVVYRFISDYTTTGLLKFFLLEKKIPELTIFAISRDNVLNRKKEELQAIYEAQIELYDKWLNNNQINSEIRFNCIGDKKLLPKDYNRKIDELENATRKNKQHSCNLLVAYNGQWEIIEATKKAREKKIELTPENYYDFLEIKTPIDLVIRTGFEKRFSGCPLYQTSYAEFVFTEYYYPELTIDKMQQIVAEFDKRNRRFGK